MTSNPPITDQDRATFLRVAEELRTSDPNDSDYVELEQAVSAMVKSAKKRRQAKRRQERRASDMRLDEATSTYRQPLDPTTELAAAPNEEQIVAPVGVRRSDRRCYICKQTYRVIDAHYHLLCEACAATNRAHRLETADLSGRTALVTGGRIKVGLHVALKLLRAGADVMVTTRFPVDAQHVYAAERDAAEWIDRLTICQADFLRSSDVEQLVEHVTNRFGHLDILINNAAQTIARPAAWYQTLVDGEQRPAPELAANTHQTGIAIPRALDSNPSEALTDWSDLVPAGMVDETGQQLDLRTRNSWDLELHEIEPIEWLTTHIVGAFVPWLLIKSVRPLLLASPFVNRFVVNVSAMEGAFSMPGKTSRHAHTNATKAALNMLTRTAGRNYASNGIHMTAVDTGWITDERPHAAKERERAKGFRPPLDVVDGAARVCHPIFAGLDGQPVNGVFLKDYEVAPW